MLYVVLTMPTLNKAYLFIYLLLCRVKNMLAGQWQPPKKPQGRTRSYYPCHLNRYFPRQNVDRTQPTDLRSVGTINEFCAE